MAREKATRHSIVYVDVITPGRKIYRHVNLETVKRMMDVDGWEIYTPELSRQLSAEQYQPRIGSMF